MQNLNIGQNQIFDGIHVRLLHVATGAISPGTPHWTRCGYPVFILIRSGAVRSEFQDAPGEFIERPAHSIIYFPQDSVRRTWLAAGETAPYVSLTFSAQTDSLFDLFPVLEIPAFIRSPEAEKIMCRLARLSGTDRLDGQLLIQELLFRYLRIVIGESVLREEVLRSCREPWFREVTARIGSHPEQPFSVEEAARRAGMSRQTFYGKFKRATGMAPLEYIRRKRLREAEPLLLGSDLSIAEIAEHLRFADQFHFSHLFRKVYGLSPLHFRRRGREKERALYRAAVRTG